MNRIAPDAPYIVNPDLTRPDSVAQNFFNNMNEANGKNKITTIEIIIQIFLQSRKVNKYIVNTGKINSADDKPNQIVLNAFPLDFVKYLETVVVAVCDIIP